MPRIGKRKGTGEQGDDFQEKKGGEKPAYVQL